MRKKAIYILFALALGAGLFMGFGPSVNLPKDASHLLALGRVGQGWDSPQRVPLALAVWAVERNYQGKVEKIYPILGKDDRLVAYGIDLAVEPYPPSLWKGMPPATALILSANFSGPAVLAEYHGTFIRDLFPRGCPKPDRLYLSKRAAVIVKYGGKYFVASREQNPEAVKASLEDKLVLSEKRDAKPRVSLLWDRFLRATSGGKRVYFTELDWSYPPGIDTNGLKMRAPIGPGDPGYVDHGCDRFGLYWGYCADNLDNVGAMANMIRFRWKGERTRLVKVRMVPGGYYAGCDPGTAGRGFGLFIFPDGDCASSKTIETIPRFWVTKDYWDFTLWNEWLWEHHRWYNTGYYVINHYLSKYGANIRWEFYQAPPFDNGPAWFNYVKERLLQGAMMIAPSFPGYTAPYYGVKDSMRAYVFPCGWDDAKQLLCMYSIVKAGLCSKALGGCFYWPAGFSFVTPKAFGLPPAWVYPPAPFSDLAPTMTFPTRVMAYQGDRVRIEADVVWDREGEGVSFQVEESPFPVVEKGKNYFVIEADAPAREEYVIWLSYSDGVNKVVHPVFVYVFPTFKVGE